MTHVRPDFETLLNAAERRALVAVLRARPELTLDKLMRCFDGRYGQTLRTITVRELLEGRSSILVPSDGGPPIDHVGLTQAKGLQGEAFDERVLQVVLRAEGRPVSASYLRARVGGPRWKLQGSLRRLAERGEVWRSGVTSSTRYRAASSSSSQAGGRRTPEQNPEQTPERTPERTPGRFRAAS